jgi:cell wall-associated NlpC family hydrolase
VKNITQITSQEFSKLIGIPWDSLDCWGIVRKFYSLHGKELPPYYHTRPNNLEESEETISKVKGNYREIPFNDLRYGDILLINLKGVNGHIGVYIGNGRMLHTSIKCNSVIVRLSQWQRRIVGIYRPRDEENTIKA